MEQRIYKKIMRRTLHVNYTDYLLKDFFKYLASEKLIRYDGRSKKSSEILDVTHLCSEKDKLNYIMDCLPYWTKMVEKYEYERPYRYTYLYKISEESINIIQEKMSQGKFVNFTNNKKCNDEVQLVLMDPTYREVDNKIYLKFSLRLESKLKANEPIKHTVLVVIHTDLRMLEVRQDTIPMAYNPIDRFYESNAKSIKAYLLGLAHIDVENVNLQAIIRYMKNTKSDEVKITSIDMARGGTRATLDSATNENRELPILDEIKHILTEDIFNDTDPKVIAIKDRFKSFIYEVEELSAVPSAKAYWEAKGYQVNISDGETEKQQPFIRWVGELKGRESMDYVAKYIMQCEGEIEAEFCD